MVQLREKELSSLDFYWQAIKIKQITDSYHIPLIINDRVDIALAVGAEGVHVGQSDLPCSVVRRLVGDDMIIGVSVSELSEAVKAEADGADYIGVGAMYATGTKTDASLVTLDELDRIRRAVHIPIVVIGGINKSTIPNFKHRGIDGIAVVSAIAAQPDVEKAARELLEMWKA